MWALCENGGSALLPTLPTLTWGRPCHRVAEGLCWENKPVSLGLLERALGLAECLPLSCRGSCCNFEGRTRVPAGFVRAAGSRGLWGWEKLEAGRLAPKQMPGAEARRAWQGPGKSRFQHNRAIPRGSGERDGHLVLSEGDDSMDRTRTHRPWKVKTSSAFICPLGATAGSPHTTSQLCFFPVRESW